MPCSFQNTQLDCCDKAADSNTKLRWRIVPLIFRRKKSGKHKNVDQEFSPNLSPTTGEDYNETQKVYGNKTDQKRNFESRLSWTDGDEATVAGVEKLEEASCEISSSEARPLQREESFPGRQHNGSLSKYEAKKRLLSWRKTTIVRKNSEQ